MRVHLLGFLFLAVTACTKGDAPGQRCDPASFVPRCAPDGTQLVCPEPAFGNPIAVSTVHSVQCFGANVCHVDGRSIGCVTPQRERCTAPETRRCVSEQLQICRPLNFNNNASPYWQSIGVRCG